MGTFLRLAKYPASKSGDWIGTTSLAMGNGSNPTAGTITVELDMDTDKIYLDGTSIPVTFSGLPAGFTVTEATVVSPVELAGTNCHATLTAPAFILPTDFDAEGGISTLIDPPPTTLALFSSTTIEVSVTMDASGPSDSSHANLAAHAIVPDRLAVPGIVGQYAILSSPSWWYDPVTDTYLHQVDDPGGDYESVDGPTVRVDAISPLEGPTAGGTPCTITGSGFFSVTSVVFGGYQATDVVVVNEHTITCVAPAHWQGPVTVNVEL
jgi:hypothetical protein